MTEQISGQLRQLLQALGGMAIGLGWLTTGQVDFWLQVILQVGGPLAMLAGIAWSWWVNRPVALVASVDAMAKDPASPIKGVVVTNTTAGRDLARALHGTTTVIAGTPDAKQIAAPG